jgi:hypothetical protein
MVYELSKKNLNPEPDPASRSGCHISRMKTAHRIDIGDVLPKDYPSACLVGRIWRPDVQGPSIVEVRGESILDVSSTFPTMRDLCEERNPALRSPGRVVDRRRKALPQSGSIPHRSQTEVGRTRAVLLR